MPELPLPLPLLSPFDFKSAVALPPALTSLLEVALALLSELAVAPAPALDCELALAELLDLALSLAFAWCSGSADFGAGALSAFGAGAGLLSAFGAGAGAGALAAFGAGWLLEPPFALFLSPSPLPPIWWSLLWPGLSLL